MRIGLTYNIRGEVTQRADDPIDAQAEFDSVETIDALERALQALGHDVVRIGHIFNLVDHLATPPDGPAGQQPIGVAGGVAGEALRGNTQPHPAVTNAQRSSLSKGTLDLVFNISEGLHGRSREAQVPALLEAYRIPYTFSDPLTLAVCHDKASAKQILLSGRVATPQACVIAAPEELVSCAGQLPPYPVMVKPVHEGSSKGIGNDSVVADDQALLRLVQRLIQSYKQPVLIEEFMAGREFTVGLVGTAAEARVLGAMEILLTDPTDLVYGYQPKQEYEQRVAYAPVTEQPLLAQLSALALQAYTLMQCRDAGRVDIRLDAAGVPYVLELNPLPGMHPVHSDLPIIAAMHGLSHSDLVALIVQSALKRTTPEPYRGA
jgi:D-alanine-D-alanine ligase